MTTFRKLVIVNKVKQVLPDLFSSDIFYHYTEKKTYNQDYNEVLSNLF